MSTVRELRTDAHFYRQWAGRFVAEEGRDIGAERRELMELATRRAGREASATLAAHIWRTTRIVLSHELQVVGE